MANHISPRSLKARVRKDDCIFCGSRNKITREHVIPRWVYNNDPHVYFVNQTNGLNQKYHTSTVPACESCNSTILSGLERYIDKLLMRTGHEKTVPTTYEKEQLIRWLEIIEYKFQVLDLIKRLVTSKKGGYVPFIAGVPISMLRGKIDTPFKLEVELRRSQRRLAVKSKVKKVNSLVLYYTKNNGHNFFHKMDDFIFFELPQHKMAIFYFYNLEFKSEHKAFRAAEKIIHQAYRH